MARLKRFLDYLAFKIISKGVADCGHPTNIEGTMINYEKSIKISLSIKDGRTPYCLFCLQKMSTRCSDCGQLIFPGDLIALHQPEADDQQCRTTDNRLSIYSRNPLKTIVCRGCIRTNCGDEPAKWLGNGQAITGMDLLKSAVMKALVDYQAPKADRPHGAKS